MKQELCKTCCFDVFRPCAPICVQPQVAHLDCQTCVIEMGSVCTCLLDLEVTQVRDASLVQSVYS